MLTKTLALTQYLIIPLFVLLFLLWAYTVASIVVSIASNVISLFSTRS